MAGGSGLGARREVLAAACDALSGLGGELWAAGSGDLAAVMSEVDRLVSLAEAARVEVACEAMRRGEPGSGALALTPVAWVRRHAPSTVAGGAGQVVALAEAFERVRQRGGRDAVMSGSLPVRSAAVVVAEAERLRPLLADGAEPAVLDGLIAMAVEHGPRGCRLVRPRLLATYGLDGQLQARAGPGEAVRVVVAAAGGRAGVGGVPVDVGCGGPGGPRGGAGSVVGAQAVWMGSGTCAPATEGAATRS